MLLKNRQLEAGSLVLSRSGNVFLILEVVKLSRRILGLRYVCCKGPGESFVDYAEEERDGVFLSDCVYVRSERGCVSTA